MSGLHEILPLPCAWFGPVLLTVGPLSTSGILAQVRPIAQVTRSSCDRRVLSWSAADEGRRIRMKEGNTGDI